MPPDKNHQPPNEPKVTHLENRELHECLSANERQHNFSGDAILAKEALIRQAQDNSSTMKNSREVQDLIDKGN